MWEDGGSDRFQEIVRLNEGAKHILRRSIAVNILALDAIVQSRKAGAGLRGFDEVSNQMRGWTKRLEAEVVLLLDASAQSVLTVSSLVKLNSQHRLMEAATKSPGAAAVLGTTLRGLEASWRRIDEDLGRQRRHMELIIATLAQLGIMASVLSRSAMIEAAYGEPALKAALTYVSQEFSASAEHLVKTINALRKSMRQAET